METVEIRLSNGMTAVVDLADYEIVKGYTWHWHKCRERYGRVVTTFKKEGKTAYVMMHRLILNAPKGVKVDHRDRNTLNNTRANLRLCTDSQNQCNQGPRSNTGYKGVTRLKRAQRRPYQAVIAVNGKDHYLGCFYTAEDAALAYDIAAKRLHGEFAYLNFPTRTPFEFEEARSDCPERRRPARQSLLSDSRSDRS
jgi:hypothetical protein